LSEVVVKSDKVAELIDRNNELISMADRRLKELLSNPEEKLKATDLVSIRDS
jgi:ethanolamine utilization cobalamin adenosyltransferase